MTQNTFFSQTNQGFGVTNLGGLDAEQLKERLLVAETIMKKLYSRNKELEEFHGNMVKQHNSQEDRASLLDSLDGNANTTFNIDKPIAGTGEHVNKHNYLSKTIRNGLSATTDLNAIDVIDNIENTLSKIDDNMDKFVTNFRKREKTLEEELQGKDDQIRALQDQVMRGTKGGQQVTFSNTNTAIVEKGQELKDNAYVRFIEKQLEESVSENK